MNYYKLSPDFYLQDTLTVAKQLIGKRLIRNSYAGVASCIITETEAYLGSFDKAAHSYRASPDGRTNIMYEAGGYAYVYLIYGMYCCFNVTTQPKGIGQAVLIRSAEPLTGIDLMFSRRQAKKNIKSLSEKNLLTGPGRLCIGMDISREQYGVSLCGDELFICEGNMASNIVATKRINIAYAEEAADYLYRFVDADSKYLSVKLKNNV